MSSETLPLDLRLALVLGDAALRGELSWMEIDKVQTSLERLSGMDAERWWLAYEALAPKPKPTESRRPTYLMGGRVDLDYVLGVERAS